MKAIVFLSFWVRQHALQVIVIEWNTFRTAHSPLLRVAVSRMAANSSYVMPHPFSMERTESKMHAQNHSERGFALLFSYLIQLLLWTVQRNFLYLPELEGGQWEERNQDLLPSAKHSSFTVVPFAVGTISGNWTSIFGSYSPITPVNKQRSCLEILLRHTQVFLC